MSSSRYESGSREFPPYYSHLTDSASNSFVNVLSPRYADEVTEVLVLRELVGSIRHCSRPLRWPLARYGRPSPPPPYVPKRRQVTITGDHDLH